MQAFETPILITILNSFPEIFLAVLANQDMVIKLLSCSHFGSAFATIWASINCFKVRTVLYFKSFAAVGAFIFYFLLLPRAWPTVHLPTSYTSDRLKRDLIADDASKVLQLLSGSEIAGRVKESG